MTQEITKMSYRKAVELREERARLINEAKEILTVAETERRELSGDEEARWKEAMADVDRLKEKIDMIEKQESLDAELRELVSRNREDRVVVPAVSDAEAEKRAWAKYLRNGELSLTSEERGLVEKRAQSTTDSAGGYTVPEGFAGYVTEAMRAFGGMRQSRATVISTDSGNNLPFPLVDETGVTGALLGENTQASEQDATFSETVLGAYKYSSGIVRVSEELLQDSGVDFEAWLGNALGTRLGRITNNHLTVGDGSSKPRGLFTAAPTGKTAASATAITADELIDLVYSLDPAYLAGAEFMMNFSTEGYIRKLKNGSGDFVWQPGLQPGQPDRILGYPVVRNQDAPSIATGQDAVLFGDISSYVIRDVRGIQLRRMVERYADFIQIGYLAWMRLDGDLIAANTTTYCPVKVLTLA